MLLSEKYVIRRNHPMFKACDELCFLSKNMYNLCNYTMRQEFISTGKVSKYGDLNKQLKHTDAFIALGSNSSQMVTKLLCQNWKSFLVAIKDYAKNPSKYLGRPRIPRYLRKDGRFICTLTNVQTRIIDGYLHFGFKRLHAYNNMFRVQFSGYHLSTRIVPKGGCYVLELIYNSEKEPTILDGCRIASIDLGLNNFVTMVNNIGTKPIVINGKGLKSYNQYWNKKIANLRSTAKKVNGLDWTTQLQQLTDKRYFKIEYFLHCASKNIVNYCIANNIGTLVVGNNPKWKQNCDMGKFVNQKFVQIPYDAFIRKLQYKCEERGIDLIVTEESYTSGTSFIDGELPVKEKYDKSRRVHRGLFKTYSGTLINADVNGAYQIMRKVFPNAFANGIVGVHLHPSITNL